MRIVLKASIAFACIIGLATSMPACAADKTEKKPNILVVWGDDIGQSNISYFTKGMMGYKTPNIDRIAAEGMDGALCTTASTVDPQPAPRPL